MPWSSTRRRASRGRMTCSPRTAWRGRRGPRPSAIGRPRRRSLTRSPASGRRAPWPSSRAGSDSSTRTTARKCSFCRSPAFRGAAACRPSARGSPTTSSWTRRRACRGRRTCSMRSLRRATMSCPSRRSTMPRVLGPRCRSPLKMAEPRCLNPLRMAEPSYRNPLRMAAPAAVASRERWPRRRANSASSSRTTARRCSSCRGAAAHSGASCRPSARGSPSTWSWTSGRAGHGPTMSLRRARRRRRRGGPRRPRRRPRGRRPSTTADGQP
mmetsp:Transcript_22784/g.65519  ORF Transcript_22784/g.65519 Transcript_22784/m.65519 type:complete len:269 (+) Transcript_22784:1426-2232(+)